MSMSLAEAVRRFEEGLKTTAWQLKNPDVDLVMDGDTFRGEQSFQSGAYMTSCGNEEVGRIYLNHLNNRIAYDSSDALIGASRFPGVHVDRRSEGRVLLEFKLGIIKEIEEDGLKAVADSKVLKEFEKRYTAQFEIECRRMIRDGIKSIEYLVNPSEFFDVYITLRSGL